MKSGVAQRRKANTGKNQNVHKIKYLLSKKLKNKEEKNYKAEKD